MAEEKKKQTRIDIAAVLEAEKVSLKVVFGSIPSDGDNAVALVKGEIHYVSSKTGRTVAKGRQKLLATMEEMEVKKDGITGRAFIWTWAHAIKGFTGPKFKRKLLRDPVQNCIPRTSFRPDTVAEVVDDRCFGVGGEGRFMLFACCISAYSLQTIEPLRLGADQTLTYLVGVTELQSMDAPSVIPKSFIRLASRCWVDGKPPGDAIEVRTIQIASCGNPSCSHTADSPSAVKILSCTRCREVGYCSVECQKTHWPKHKPFCLLYAL